MKKIIAFVLAIMVMASIGVGSYALVTSESGRPEIIGVDLYERLFKEHQDEDCEPEFELAAWQAWDCWVVLLHGTDEATDVDYSAMGLYEEFPGNEEIRILWANRMTDDEMDELISSLEASWTTE